MLINSPLANDMSSETAAALMIAAGLMKKGHPDKLTYTDNDTDYELPEGITKEENETFDTVKELWKAKTEDDEDRTVVWGVGILNKNQDNETVNRMIYPDGTQISLINFNGVSGLG